MRPIGGLEILKISLLSSTRVRQGFFDWPAISPPVPPMTAFRHIASDEEIAAVLTYVRNSWSNRAKRVDAKKVASVRAETAKRQTFWSAAEIVAKYPLEDGRAAVAGCVDSSC